MTKCNEMNVPVKKCSADDYFTDEEGNYHWSAEEIANAHSYCRGLAEESMSQRIAVVIIDNTNTMQKEMNPYIKMAKRNGYRVVKKVVGNFDEESLKFYAERNVHRVPLETIKRMAGRFHHE